MANFFAGAKGVKRIVLIAVAFLLVAILIAGNIVLNYFSPLLHPYFGGLATGGDKQMQENAVGQADDLIGEIAEESMVLLKNENYLPLPKSTKINFFGWNSTDQGFLVVGGGSGASPINEGNKYHTTLLEAFTEAEMEYNLDLAAAYSRVSSKDADFWGDGGSTGKDATETMINPPASFYTDDLMTAAKNYSKTAFVVLGRWGCENGGGGELKNIKSYQNGAFLELTANEKVIFENLKQYGFDVTVLLNTTNPIELGFLEEYDNIKACIYVGIPGQSGARAIPKIITGEVTPSGRLSDTYAYDWQTYNPSYANTTSANSSIVYQEGIYFGYRWYETADAEGYFTSQGTSYDKVVQFPFGYGLSYTKFKQEIVETSWKEGEKLEAGKKYSVVVRVTNIGSEAGRDVVQLYYSAPYTKGGIEKSAINLLAFDKTALLQPNSETEGIQEVKLTFTAYDMASYDAYDMNKNGFKGYELDEGAYTITLRANAHELFPTPEENSEGTNTVTIASENIQIANDPTTNAVVENLFTGDDAYANMPIDGSTGITGGVTYLSRADFAGTLATAQAGGITSAASSAANYTYTGYDNDAGIAAEVANFGNAAEMGKYLVTLETGDKATSAQLNGTSEAELTVNETLLIQLSDWDSPMWDFFLGQLSESDAEALIGRGGFRTEAIASIGKPRQQNTDGPAGFNSAVISPGKAPEAWAVFPAETLSGCSWSQRLMYNLGQAQGMIGNSTNTYGWYAPGVNLHRSVYNSRNYEYYSEDGLLSGKLAAETIRGAKEKNLYCYLKHFVMSEPGQNATDWYTWTTEQALREMYLKPFEIAVKEGGANAMMSAFNKLGAVWCGYNHALLTDVLRKEWGFKGSVITDWDQGYMNDYNKAVKAGNDLWLNNANTDASLNYNDVGAKYGAKLSVKGIVYTYVDTYVTAMNYQKGIDNGTIEDKYSITLGAGVSTTPHSTLFVALWTIVDIVLIAGIGVCVLFMFLPKDKKTASNE